MTFAIAKMTRGRTKLFLRVTFRYDVKIDILRKISVNIDRQNYSITFHVRLRILKNWSNVYTSLEKGRRYTASNEINLERLIRIIIEGNIFHINFLIDDHPFARLNHRKGGSEDEREKERGGGAREGSVSYRTMTHSFFFFTNPF